MRKGKLYIILGVTISLLLLGPLGCKKVAELTPEIVIEKAHAATTEVKSFHFSMSMTMTGWSEGIPLMEGNIVSPDRMHVAGELEGQKYEMVYIGDKMYERDSETGQWQIQEGRAAQAALVSMQRFAEGAQTMSIAERLKGLEDIEELPEEVIDGINCVHYRGRIDPLKGLREQLAEESDPKQKEGLQQLLEAQEQMEMTVTTEVWIGKGDYLVRQQRVIQSMKAPPGGILDQGTPVPERTIMTVTVVWRFSDFNEPVEIEAPL